MHSLTLLAGFPGSTEWIALILWAAVTVFLWYKTIPHILNRKFKQDVWKGIWLVVVIIFPVFGALFYRAWS